MDYTALFLAGLLGGGHCLGMCGGVVMLMNRAAFSHILAYNAGRVLTYIFSGFCAGLLGEVGFLFAQSLIYRALLYFFASFLMLAMGFYLLGIPFFLKPFEKMGGVAWGKIAPLTQKFFPVQNFKTAWCLGGLWGFIPCGLVYAALSVALSSANALEGALLMASFALGTLPMMLFAPFLLSKITAKTRALVQKIAGFTLLLFGCLGIYRVLLFWKIF